MEILIKINRIKYIYLLLSLLARKIIIPDSKINIFSLYINLLFLIHNDTNVEDKKCQKLFKNADERISIFGTRTHFLS